MVAAAIAAGGPAHSKPWYKHLYVQVLCAIALGVLLGVFYPDIGAQMKPLGDAFIKLIKMLIAPIIFCTVVHGIASMEDMKKVGRVGIKALIYFEVMTTIALVIGLIIVNLWQPGVGMNIDPASLDAKAVAAYTAKAGEQSTVDFLLHIIPTTVVGAFADGVTGGEFVGLGDVDQHALLAVDQAHRLGGADAAAGCADCPPWPAAPAGSCWPAASP